MKTRTLVLRVLDYDCLPLDGTQIVFFDSLTQMGMFEQHFTQAGEVTYMHGDIASTLEQAIEMGGYVTLDLNDDSDLAIPVGIEGGELEAGTLWMYEHDYLPVLDTHYFPFQQQQYYEIALEQGWCSKTETGRESIEVPDAGGSVVMTYIYEDVIFNNKTFHVKWFSSNGGLEYHLLDYAVKGDRNESNDTT